MYCNAVIKNIRSNNKGAKMAENYSLNSRFGFNVSQQGAKTQQQVQKTNIDLSKTAADLFDSFIKCAHCCSPNNSSTMRSMSSFSTT